MYKALAAIVFIVIGFPPTVRAEPVEAWARWFEAHACGECGGRESPRRARYLFFASPKKSTQKKGDPQSATPALRYGATCVVSVAGCAVELALRCARRSDNHGELVHEARALRRACHPATAPPQAQPAGGGQPNSQQPHGPLLRSAVPARREALAPARWGRAQRSEAMARVDVRSPGSLQDAPRSAAASGSGLAIV